MRGWGSKTVAQPAPTAAAAAAPPAEPVATGAGAALEAAAATLVSRLTAEAIKTATATNIDGEPTAADDALNTSHPLAGTYRRLPTENGWHVGQITLRSAAAGAGSGGDNEVVLQWTNAAGVSWELLPSDTPDVLRTGPENPYCDTHPVFLVKRSEDGRVIGVAFQSELYWRDGAGVVRVDAGGLQRSSGGLKGYVSMKLPRNAPKMDADFREGFGYGMSFYVSVWPLIEAPIASFQIGLPSTWIIPNNADFCQPLCPPGTLASNWAADRGPYFRDVFQTIEGGLGYWCSTRFGSVAPKYRMNGTPNGYNHEVSTPGFGFGQPNPLREEKIGMAAVSNRLLIPPDGFTFPPPPDCTGMLGNAWMALPLTPERKAPGGHPTGNLCWTLFLESENFSGPVAFWIPEIWSELSKGYRTIDGRGLDARPGLANGGAMEVNTVPFFEADEDGTMYGKVPRLQFPVDDDGVTVLMSDIKMYSESALFAPMADGELPPRPFATAGKAWTPSMEVRPWQLKHGGHDRGGSIGSAGLQIEGIEAYVKPQATDTADGSSAFTLRWESDPTGVSTAVGEGFRNLPEYVATKDGVCTAIPNPPSGTKLSDQRFQPHSGSDEYHLPAEIIAAATDGIDPALGPFSAQLSDGSELEYIWCRFVDQPSLWHLDWSDEDRDALQSKVEQIHVKWAGENSALPPRSVDKPLVHLDAAQIVDPPVGCEIGYVPVVLRQRWACDGPNPAKAAANGAITADRERQPLTADDYEAFDAIEVRSASYTEAIKAAMNRDSGPKEDITMTRSVSPPKTYNHVVGGIVVKLDTPRPTPRAVSTSSRGKQAGRAKSCTLM
mmetsp:Transcript_5014/g.15240  ORF Transcript_5014/g.15240 Transcript_5014/m.15240 type:complete len:834 (-) Transcript_5014:29-2530(-)